MGYPKDPNLTGFKAVKFHNVLHPHEVDHPCGHNPEEEMAPLPTWTIEMAKRKIGVDRIDTGRAPRPSSLE